MSRADSTARRKARKEKSAHSLQTMPGRQARRRQKEQQAEEARLAKLRACPYHHEGADLQVGDIYYKEGVEQPLMHLKWGSISRLVCGCCGGDWLFYYVKRHP